jgi:voltage-dependent calcium channel L type alpha-1D
VVNFKFKDVINYIFAGIFTFEAGFKIYALRKDYFRNGWHLFDFIIVCGTYIGIIATTATSVEVGAQTTIIRSFRILRIIRLIKKAKSLRMIFNTLILTLPSLANVGALLLLFWYVYAILGVFLFSTIKLQEHLNDHANFQNFPTAFLTLIRFEIEKQIGLKNLGFQQVRLGMQLCMTVSEQIVNILFV